MDLIENWVNIFERHDEVAIFPFLKRLNATQKSDLLPQISKTAKAYLELKDRLINGKHFYTKKASHKQERILNYSLLVTIPNRQHSSFKWLNKKVIATQIVVDELLSWHCPNWFSDYFNEQAQLDFIALPSYELVMQMADKNYLQPSELLIAKLLIRLPYSKIPNRRRAHDFQPQNLTLRNTTLEIHFWYLFKYPTQIYSSKRWLSLEFGENANEKNWYTVIKKYVDNGKIDRFKLLESCLKTTKNPVFNKLAIGWFIGLFESIAPTEMELLTLQKELFETYTISNTKAINIILKAIQRIVDFPDFEVEDCLIDFDKLLVDRTRVITSSAIVIMEKLAGHYPDKRAFFCKMITKCFKTRIASEQHKAAKFITQIGAEDTQFLKKIILPYKANLLHSTQEILATVLGEMPNGKSIKNKNRPKNKYKLVELLNKQNEVVSIDNFYHFLNLGLQIFDNKAPYHFDQFLASLIIFQKEIKGENIGQLLPLFKRAYQLVFKELPSNHGMLDNMLATFLVDYSGLLTRRYPKDSRELQDLATFYLEQGFYINDPSGPFDLNRSHLNRWYNPNDPSQVYTPIKLLLEEVLMLLYQEKVQPLLSTPTHSPSWINLVDLIEKLVFYQENKIVPYTIDFQIAISRTAFEGHSSALKLANQKLKGHYLKLINYLLTPESNFLPKEKKEEQTNEDYELLVAAVTKYSNITFDNTVDAKINHSERASRMLSSGSSKHFRMETLATPELPSSIYTGNYNWMVFWEERQKEDWNPKTQKNEFVGKPFIYKELQVKTPKDANFEAHPNFLYQYFPGSKEAFRPNLSDVKRLLGLLPNNPSPLIMLLVADNLKYPTFWESVAKKKVEEMIGWLKEQPHLKYTLPIHLFLATAMLCEAKTIRIKAGKIWENAVLRDQLDAINFGQILGRLENKEFAPLKRFTDLAQDHLLNISAFHNKALEKTIAHLLAKLPPIPIKYTKQLLMLYRELLATNQSTIKNERLLLLLVLWEESPSLRKVLKSLRNFIL